MRPTMSAASSYLDRPPPSFPAADAGRLQTDTDALEDTIDHVVYQLYDLTDEEIALIETAAKR